VTRSSAIELCALALTATALIALAPLAPLACALGGATALAGPRLLRAHRTAARWSGLMLALVALAGAAILAGSPPPASLASAIAAMLGLQRAGRSSPAHDRALLPLAVLALALASVVTPGPAAALAIVLTAAIAPVLGVLTTTAGSDGERTGVVPRHLVPIGAAGAALCVACFIIMPRPGSATLGLAPDPERARVGFAGEVAIGEIGELLDDTTPVLRFALGGDLPAPRLIRGVALDAFDGRRWRSTEPARPAPTTRPADAVPVRVHHEAEAGPVAFAPGMIAAIEADRAVFEPDAGGTWRLSGPPRAVRYTAWIDRAPPPVPAAEHARWLALPPIEPRVVALAAQVLGDATDGPQAARQVAAWLARETSHTLAPRDPSLDAPLDEFLLVRRSGHCEYHATAAAVMLRLGGFPARVVHGYADPRTDGRTWTVRRGSAHAWIEVLDGEGRWLAVDVTPGGPRPPPPPGRAAAWAEHLRDLFADRVLTYDGLDQREAILGAATAVGERLPGRLSTPALGFVLLLLAVTAAAVGLGLLATRLTRALAGEAPTLADGPIARAHRTARRLLVRAGYRIPTALPPASAADWLTERDAPAGEALRTLAWLHYRTRYGGEDEAALLPEAQAALRFLRRHLRRRPGPRSPTGSSPSVPERRAAS